MDPLWYGEQDANGVDLSLIRENLKLTPRERLLRGDRARRSTLRLLEYGRRQRENMPEQSDLEKIATVLLRRKSSLRLRWVTHFYWRPDAFGSLFGERL
mgnify:CR=1 FL=1